MASDTAPAAVPGPENAPHSTAPAAPTHSGPQQPGGLAGLLAAVEPTRPPAAFTLNPTTGEGAASGQHEVHGTSADFQNGDPAQNAGGKQQNTASGSGNTRQETSVVRAWLLAGAERWKKGADARNKRLDIQKARAQALQVKETRTVSVNRSSDGTIGKTTGGSGGKSDGGKSLSNKSGGGAPKGPKNASGPQPKGPHSAGAGAGGSGGAGRGSKEQGSQPGTGRTKGPGGSDSQGGRGGRGGGKPSGGDGKNHSSRRSPHNSAGASKDKPGGQTTSPSHSKTSGPSISAGAGSGTGPGKGKKTSGGAGKPQTTETCGDGSGISTSKGKPTKSGTGPATGADGTKTSTNGRDGTRPAGKQDQPGKGSGRIDPAGKGGPAAGASGDTDPAKNSTPTGKDGSPPPTDKPKPGTPKPDTGPTAAKDPKKPAPGTGTPGTSPGRAPGSGIDLKASREAGYRDGTRAATVTAHVEAWRDGVRDGYRDKKEDATREKQRLDKAHDQYKARPQPDKDQPVTVPASSADYQPTTPPKPDHAPGPQPIQVTGTDATHIHLAGGDRPHIKHGEVRTLRRFQQTLDAKTDRMTQVAEATRTLEAHAREQAKQITQLLDQARSTEGGDKLVTALTRLAETADVQTGKAAEVHKRGVRAAEACKTLHANTETRYGGIYKAVVDSPDGAAKMSYYQEMSHA